VRLFASAREAAGRALDEFDATTVGEVRIAMLARYGPDFGDVLATSRIWVNGDEPHDGDATALADGDEVAVLPPVSGGAGRARPRAADNLLRMIARTRHAH
jgi:molybdopterin synthase sulfur carrier subunit